MNVRATQPISSSPVEVSWTLPSSNGAIQITGYRVFYGTSQGRSVLVPSYINSMVLNFVDSSLRIETVSVRSESSQLPSESISATVTAVGTCMSSNHYNNTKPASLLKPECPNLPHEMCMMLYFWSAHACTPTFSVAISRHEVYILFCQICPKQRQSLNHAIKTCPNVILQFFGSSMYYIFAIIL